MAAMHVLDFVVFFAVILFSLGIGIYHSFNQRNSSEYLQGRRQMGLVPVSISMMVSFVSAITMQGVPAEVYVHGLFQFLPSLLSVAGSFLAIWTFVPLYYDLNLISIFQFLEVRFKNRIPALLACFLNILSFSCLMGIAMVGPAQMLQSIIKTPTWLNILVMMSVCTVYTSIGGIKAVVWADVLQAVTMFVGFLLVVILGLTKISDSADVWQEMLNRGQLDINWGFNPFVRNSFWIASLSLMVTNFEIYQEQPAMMRYTALNSLTKAKITVVVGALGYILLCLICAAAAIVLYAFYLQKGCDPIASGDIYSPNQIVPYFVFNVLDYPGIPGLFASAIVSSTLSSVSSLQNSLTAITWQNIFSQFLSSISEERKTRILKLTVVVYGVLSLLFAFFADAIGGTLFQISNAALSVFNGPAFGMFLLAGTFPFIGPWCALFGCIVSLCISLWLAVGRVFNPPSWFTAPVGIDDTCIQEGRNYEWNITTTEYLPNNVTNFREEHSTDSLNSSSIYDTSSFLYTSIGTTTCFVIGLLLSTIPGLRQKGRVDGRHLFPFARKLFQVKKLCKEAEIDLNESKGCLAEYK